MACNMKKSRITGKTLIVANVIFTVALLCNSSYADHPSDLETKIKAAYLYNFLRFVEWPEDIELINNICVYGIEEKHHSAFNSMATISKKNQKIKVDLFNGNEEIEKLSSCQIIFITDKAKNKSKAVIEYLNKIKDNHILTVGESNEFINNGGMINFIRIKDKIRFEINQHAATAAGLKISSQVLRIAERVISKDEQS